MTQANNIDGLSAARAFVAGGIRGFIDGAAEALSESSKEPGIRVGLICIAVSGFIIKYSDTPVVKLAGCFLGIAGVIGIQKGAINTYNNKMERNRQRHANRY